MSSVGSLSPELPASCSQEPCGKRVRVSKMTWWTTDAELEELFAECGPTVSVIFEEDRVNGKSKGVAVVDFKDRFACYHHHQHHHQPSGPYVQHLG